MASDDAAAALHEGDPPAPIGRRIGAAILDLAIAAVAAGVGVGVSAGLAGPCYGPGCEIIIFLGLGGSLGVLGLVQGFMIGTRGQSMGKRAARIRILRADGSPAGLVRGALLRTLPAVLVPGLLFGICELVWRSASADPDSSSLIRSFGYGGLSNLLTVIPAVASALFLLVDAALALSPSRRTLHDRIAGTIVTRAPGVWGQSSAPPSEPPS